MTEWCLRRFEQLVRVLTFFHLNCICFVTGCKIMVGYSTVGNIMVSYCCTNLSSPETQPQMFDLKRGEIIPQLGQSKNL